jgi:hypothetical protein
MDVHSADVPLGQLVGRSRLAKIVTRLAPFATGVATGARGDYALRLGGLWIAPSVPGRMAVVGRGLAVPIRLCSPPHTADGHRPHLTALGLSGATWPTLPGPGESANRCGSTCLSHPSISHLPQ